MMNLLTNELYKIFARKKIYVLIGLMFIYEAYMLFDSYIANRDFGALGLAKVTGQTFPVIFLESLSAVVLPFLMIILISDIFTTEYANGSLKLPLLRQVTRRNLLQAKIQALFIIIVGVLFTAFVVSYILGAVFFGWGDRFVLKWIDLSSGQGILFTLVLYVATLLPLTSFGLMIFLISLFSHGEGETIGLGVGSWIVFAVIGHIFEKLTPYIITTYLNIYSLIILKITPKELTLGLVIVIFYSSVCYFTAQRAFKRKDLLT